MKENDKNENRIVLKPSGTITADRVEALEQDFAGKCGGREVQELVMDLENVSYISSACLRLIMKLRGKAGRMSVINAAPEVFDVLSMTGFTEIMDVRRAYRELSLHGLSVIGDGFTSTVYRLDAEKIVKLYNEDVPEDMLIREQKVSKAAFLAGVPTMITFETVKAGGRLGVVYEAFNFDTLLEVYRDAPDEKRRELTEQHARTVREMCGLQVSGDAFMSFKEDIQEKLDREKAHMDPAELQVCQEMIDAIPDDHTFVHGDCHMGNFMLSGDGELKVIDLGISGYGNPVFSLSSICLYRLFGELFPEEAYRAKGSLSIAEGLTCWDRFVKAYFPYLSDEEARAAGESIYLYCCLFSSLNYAHTPLVSEETFRMLCGKVVAARNVGFDCTKVFAQMRAPQ